MCGLVGIAGKLGYGDEAVMKHLLWLDYWRGPHSTGMAALRNNGDCLISKIPSHPLDLFDTKRFTTALSGSQSSVFLGHNRLATKGAVNHVNSHPFRQGDIVGAHNGTLSVVSHLDLEEQLDETFTVDSEAIFAHIHAFGAAKTIPLLQGAWALTYIDTAKGTLNFIRNDQRPLWYAMSEDYNKLFWASEWEMIHYSLLAPAQKPKLLKDAQGCSFFPFEIDTHYTFDLDKLQKATSRVKPVIQKLEGKEEPVADTLPFTAGFNQDWNNFGKKSTSTTRSTTESRTASRTSGHPEFVRLVGTDDDPYAGIITPEKFAQLTKFGCAWCGGDVTWGDVGVTILERDDAVFCPRCSKGTDTRIHVKNIQEFK